MKHESLRRKVVGSLVALVMMASWSASAAAQEPPQQGAAVAQPPAAAATDANAAKKPRKRLPAYFGKVVTDKQRAQIYEIQAKFTEQIATLQEQLDALSAKRDAEIEQVLTEEQRAEIARLKSERKARRTNGSSDDAAPNGS
jgi:predicted transglutaminase-like cysteine proteinase